MDLDELIRASLREQAGRAPDADAVLAGVPARARARRRRRIAVPAVAVLAVLAAAVPYAVARDDRATAPAPPAATATPTVRAESVPLRIEPGWLPAGWKEWGRRASSSFVQRDYGNAVDADSSRTALRWATQQPVYTRTTAAERLTVAGREAFWYSDQPTFRRLGYGQAELVLRWSPAEWVTVAVQWRDPAERKALAVRIAAGVRPSRDVVTANVRLGRLPDGSAPRVDEISIRRVRPAGFLSSTSYQVRTGQVRVGRDLLPPDPRSPYPGPGAQPVTVGGRRGYYYPGPSPSPGAVTSSGFGTALPDGTRLSISAVATKAEMVLTAGSVVVLPVDLSWAGR